MNLRSRRSSAASCRHPRRAARDLAVLTQTFCHVPGIGKRTEKALWTQGCRDWDVLLSEPDTFSYGSASRTLARRVIEESRGALDEGRYQFFAESLRASETWRAWEQFRDSCVYLDIETDGSNNRDNVTMIGLYDGRDFKCLIKGQDLENFRDVISHYAMVVTFFGTGFDLPVLEKRFRGFRFDQIHLDLCPTLKKLGIKGGLKKIERQLGLQREEGIDGLTGWDAVQLWRRYLRGDEKALDTLIAYNRADVVNMEPIAEYLYREMKRETVGDQLVLF